MKQHIEKQSIKLFTDLFAWQEGHKLVIEVYKITKNFPKEEMFGLTSQLRRAVVSITSNIAEGFSRRTYSDKAHFYSMAQGSVTEVQNQLIIARDILYISIATYNKVFELSIVVHKIINGLVKSTRQLAHTS